MPGAILGVTFCLAVVSHGRLLAEPTPPLAPDIPATFTRPTQAADHERRDVMIAMRDGVKLHTVILVPRGARRAPIILTRTPYNASSVICAGASRTKPLTKAEPHSFAAGAA